LINTEMGCSKLLEILSAGKRIAPGLVELLRAIYHATNVAVTVDGHELMHRQLSKMPLTLDDAQETIPFHTIRAELIGLLKLGMQVCVTFEGRSYPLKDETAAVRSHRRSARIRAAAERLMADQPDSNTEIKLSCGLQTVESRDICAFFQMLKELRDEVRIGIPGVPKEAALSWVFAPFEGDAQQAALGAFNVVNDADQLLFMGSVGLARMARASVKDNENETVC